MRARSILFPLALSLLLTGCGRREDIGAKAGPVTISVWHPWGGTQKEKFERVVKLFEQSHPGIRVRVVFTPNDLSNNQKFFTSVAANKPPDVCFVDGPQVSEWAQQGALQPLDGLVKREKIKSTDYFPPCWAQNVYDDRVWAMTYCADPNFAFVWNKAMFRDAGLDPDRPPRSIEELDRYADKLTRRNAHGDIIQIGIIPWAQYGSANSIFTWGWAFGGDFYDYKNRRIIADKTQAVQALQWMIGYAKKYDIRKVASLQQGFGTAEQNPLYVGKLAMQCLHISGIEEIKQYAPNLDYGISYIPAPANGEQHSSWVGGWCLALPRGSRHPKEGWEFIRWMCADEEGTNKAAHAQGLFPGFKPSPYFSEIRGKKGYGEFLEVLEECRHQRPVMPAQAFYMGSLARAVDYALYGKKTPLQALKDSSAETQLELDQRIGKR